MKKITSRRDFVKTIAAADEVTVVSPLLTGEKILVTPSTCKVDGKVMINYDPRKGASVHSERPIKIEFGEGIRSVKIWSFHN